MQGTRFSFVYISMRRDKYQNDDYIQYTSQPTSNQQKMNTVCSLFAACCLLLNADRIIVDAFSAPREKSSSSSVSNDEKNKWKAVNEVLPQDYYRQVYNGAATAIPWNIGGRPQPTVVEQAKTGIFAGKTVLDCGCGLGENAMYLTEHVENCTVTAFDLSQEAIRVAQQQQQQQAPGAIDFRVASCTNLANSFDNDETFDIAIDSACLHCLSDDDAIQYVNSLTKMVTERIFVGCFSTANEGRWSNPRRLSRDDLERYFQNGWEIVSIRDVWWSRPAARGSKQGAFCRALWMEATRKNYGAQ